MKNLKTDSPMELHMAPSFSREFRQMLGKKGHGFIRTTAIVEFQTPSMIKYEDFCKIELDVMITESRVAKGRKFVETVIVKVYDCRDELFAYEVLIKSQCTDKKGKTTDYTETRNAKTPFIDLLLETSNYEFVYREANNEFENYIENNIN